MTTASRTDTHSTFSATHSSQDAGRSDKLHVESGIGAVARTFGNAGMLKLMRAPARPARSIRSVKASADGLPGRTKVLKDGEATFSFDADVIAKGCAQLEYEWDFGDGKSSTERAPSHTYTKHGVYSATVTVSCAGRAETDAVSETVRIVVLKVDHATSTVHPKPRRTELGVGESVTLFVEPILPEVTARVVGGGSLGESFFGVFQYEAPAVEARPSVFIESPTLDAFEFRFSVFAPNYVTMLRQDSTIMAFNGPGVFMQHQATLHAFDAGGVERDVSLHNIEVTALPARAEALRGYFAALSSNWVFENPGFNSTTVAARNLVYPADSVFIAGPQFERPPLWTDGSFECERPWRYRVKHSNEEHDFANTVQVVKMEGPGKEHHAGTMTVQEDAACASRAPDDFEYPCPD